MASALLVFLHLYLVCCGSFNVKNFTVHSLLLSGSKTYLSENNSITYCVVGANAAGEEKRRVVGSGPDSEDLFCLLLRRLLSVRDAWLRILQLPHQGCFLFFVGQANLLHHIVLYCSSSKRSRMIDTTFYLR
jgi:hypothetical protein